MVIDGERSELPERVIGRQIIVVDQFHRIGSLSCQNLALPQTLFRELAGFREIVRPLKPNGVFSRNADVQFAHDVADRTETLINADVGVERTIGIQRGRIMQRNTNRIETAIQRDIPVHPGNMNAIAENVGNRP